MKKRTKRNIKNSLLLIALVAAVFAAATAINAFRDGGLSFPSFEPEETGKSSPEDINSEGVPLPENQSPDSPVTPETPEELPEEPEEEDWRLILVNKLNPIPEDYRIEELTELREGHACDSRIYPDLQKMFDDAREAGILPRITSSYRTAENQQEIMDEKIAEYKAAGHSDDEAAALAERWVAIPGTSEHQIGLAVDISTADWSKQDANIVWDWFDINCYKYGFIRRYPEDKISITGTINEPWHFRYVGHDAAKYIWENELCLEEYLGKAEVIIPPEELEAALDEQEGQAA